MAKQIIHRGPAFMKSYEGIKLERLARYYGCVGDWIGYPTDRVLGPKGIFLVESGTKPTIAFFDFCSQRITRIISLDRKPVTLDGLPVSPDETYDG